MSQGMVKLFIETSDGGLVLEQEESLKANRGDDQDFADECGDTHNVDKLYLIQLIHLSYQQ
jgi:hypothetical protein